MHPNQKKYQGMSRMDVFIHHVNPDLPQLDRGQLAKYIGFKTQTSIRRSQYVTVQYEKFQLENPAVLNQLASMSRPEIWLQVKIEFTLIIYIPYLEF
ncbi:hypothetical protein PL373_19790 [Tenacibaculum maritimum]|nr:hypothetical protein [Tenacibaculum maritimum]